MKNLNLKPFLYALLFVSALAWFGIATLEGLDLADFQSFLRPLPKVITIDLILFSAFAKWLWRWRYLQGWLVPFPDLNGTWEGHIQTTWVNPETGQRPGPIPAIVTIKQSFTRISCVMRTAEMTSYSYAEGFRLDAGGQLRQLAYTYTSQPKLTIAERSTNHDGTMVFDIKGKPPTKLQGRYWTERKTTGEVIMSYRCKELLDELPEDMGAHPVSDVPQEDTEEQE